MQAQALVLASAEPELQLRIPSTPTDQTAPDPAVMCTKQAVAQSAKEVRRRFIEMTLKRRSPSLHRRRVLPLEICLIL